MGVKFLCVLVLRYRVKRGCFWGVVCLGEGVGVKGLLKTSLTLWLQLVRWIFRWE